MYSVVTAVPMHLSWQKPVGRWFFEVRNIWKPYIFMAILTISTTLLNDNNDCHIVSQKYLSVAICI